MKIYNTNQEIGCRILLILQIVKKTYSIERIGYYDYLFKILYLIFDYPHKHYTFKHFEI